MYYSVCVSALFGGTPMPDAIALAAQTGAQAYEFWGWWGLDLDEVAQAQALHGLKLSAMCTKMVPLTVPARRGEYLAGLVESLAAAKKLGCRTLISQVGAEQADMSRDAQHTSIVEGLRACVPLLEAADVTLVIEPLNTLINHRGYYLARSDEAFDIVKEVGSPHVKVLFDVYHQQVTEGNLINNLTQNVEWIGHIHIAGHPGRHEILGRNEIHYPSVLEALREAGYRGAVGLEYIPLKDPVEGVKALLQAIPL